MWLGGAASASWGLGALRCAALRHGSSSTATTPRWVWRAWGLGPSVPPGERLRSGVARPAPHTPAASAASGPAARQASLRPQGNLHTLANHSFVSQPPMPVQSHPTEPTRPLYLTLTHPQGNLYMLANHSFINFNAADNPKMVGAALNVPARRQGWAGCGTPGCRRHGGGGGGPPAAGGVRVQRRASPPAVLLGVAPIAPVPDTRRLPAAVRHGAGGGTLCPWLQPSQHRPGPALP